MAVYVVVQCIQDLFPHTQDNGQGHGIESALILLSLSVWGTLLGFTGLIIALPLTTMLLSYYDRYISSREDGESPASIAEIRASLKICLEMKTLELTQDGFAYNIYR